MVIRGLWTAVLALGATGCATLFSGTSEEVTFTSEPAGARVLIDGDEIGTTPVTRELDRSTFRQSIVLMQKPGYTSEKFQLKKTLNTTALFNCTSILSWGTDALTGAMMEYAPNKYFVELTPKGKRADAGHRRALQFVLVAHRELVRDIARRQGPYLRSLAELFGASEPPDYARFVATLAVESSALGHYAHPSDLYRQVTSLLSEQSFTPRDCGCSGFEVDPRIGLRFPQSRSQGTLDPALTALLTAALDPT